MEISDEMIETMLPAVREQMESSATPYVKEAFIRLTEKESLPQQDALELMAQVLAVCANDMIVSGEAFNDKSYKELLKSLPLLPDESE